VQAALVLSGAPLGTVATILMALGQQPEDQPIQLRRRAVEARAAIDVLDLDDPGTVPPDSIDRLDQVTPVTNEPTFDELRHGFPALLYGLTWG
jgi:hypothetical protein